MADFEIVHGTGDVAPEPVSVPEEFGHHHEHHHHEHPVPAHEDVALRAYFIWLAETESPTYTDADGEDWAVGNWLQAEDELTQECGKEV